MTPQAFKQWVELIYATRDDEFDCQQTQSHLPAYVDAQIDGYPVQQFATRLEAHLRQCPDCREVYEGLFYVADQAAAGEVDVVETADLPELTPIAAD